MVKFLFILRINTYHSEEEINIKGKHSKIMEWLNDTGNPITDVSCPTTACNFDFKDGTTLEDYTNPTLPMIAEEFYR